MIIKRRVPHGAIPLEGISDKATREAVMKLNENIASITQQLSDVQSSAQSIEKDMSSVKSRVTAIEVSLAP